MASGPPVDTQFLWNIFQRVDKRRSGLISAEELKQALAHGSWPNFNVETCKLMIAMFDRSARGQLQFEEFCALWQYVSDWDVCFKSFDIDYSGTINRNELKMALHHFGYRLTDPIVDLIIHRFDRYGREDIMFDDFIQCCIVLYNLTSAFRVQDTDHDGIIRVHYEKFLAMIFGLPL